MQHYEYKVIPAPRRGEKARGARTTADRFALALTQMMNDLGREGWEYLRADTLPCEERSGLTSKTTSFQNMLVFRRSLAPAAAAPAAAPDPAEAARRALTAAPEVAAPAPSPIAGPIAAGRSLFAAVTRAAPAAPGQAPPVGPATPAGPATPRPDQAAE
ncbi:DUF4177 domain-containing protein [Ruixingdingia sedimenti]|uniref:DUF4177 domain-containing protein n=1 Tax=Ruixingdingia sedimenti TaxID=3073604 RepID=A0ABU1FAZ0_9RHOB|nr:DUF4177 domain-containing protein [Xinfangfangia sp. LG-4]MDR5654029.1 DUF4177 domain-containing protein [Xinfangfangia sp. LG-4]